MLKLSKCPRIARLAKYCFGSFSNVKCPALTPLQVTRAAPFFALLAKWVITASVGYGSGPWRKWGLLGAAVNLFLKTILPTLIGDNRF
jgi:hypothetical protein